MSTMGDLRTQLKEIHAMLPLSDREQVLAGMVFYADEGDIEQEMCDDPTWWGEQALIVARALGGNV